MTSPTTRTRQAANCSRVIKSGKLGHQAWQGRSSARIIPAADPQSMLDQDAHHVAEEDVSLLDARRLLCRHDDWKINHRTKLTTVASQKADCGNAHRPGNFHSPYHVGRIAGRRDRDQHIAITTEALDLTRKDFFVAEV